MVQNFGGGSVKLENNIGSLAFDTVAGGIHSFYVGGSEKVRIDGSGNLMVGKTSTAYPLDIAGNAAFGGTTGNTLRIMGTGAEGGVHILTATDYAQIRAGKSNNFGVALPLRLAAGSTDVLTISGTSVGIGTVNPQATCEISKNYTGAINLLRLANTQNYNDGGGYISFFGNYSVDIARIYGLREYDGQGGTLIFHTRVNVATGSTEKMRITSAGNVGIGVTKPLTLLNVSGTTTCQTNSLGSDGTFIDFRVASISKGAITVSGETVSYGNFVGSHPTQLNAKQKELPIGSVVISTGKVLENKDKTDSNYVYVDTTVKEADNKVYGVWLGKMGDGLSVIYGDETKPIYSVAQVGLFKARVTDTNGNIFNGDYLETSKRKMEAQKQSDNIRKSSTLAKALVDVIWDEVQPDEKLGYKWKLIPVIF